MGTTAAGNGTRMQQYRTVCGRCGARRVDQQLGLEPLPFCATWERGPRCTECYICKMVAVFEAVHRVLRDDGTCWINIGDCYASSGTSGLQRLDALGARLGTGGGHKHTSQPCGRAPTPPGLREKNLVGLPWRLALALQAAGWWLRQDIVWAKKAPLPESMRDRCTKSHEYLFLLAKQPTYYFDSVAIREDAQDWGHRDRSQSKHTTNGFALNGQPPHHGLTNGNAAQAGRNKRSVWWLGPEPYAKAHFAVMPTKLVEPCILAGSSAAGVCSACGSPWRRMVERGDLVRCPGTQGGTQFPRSGKDHQNNQTASSNRTQQLTMAPGRMYQQHTTGWAASCACNAGTVPATILDPFTGSGTVNLTSVLHGRQSVGIDLNTSYLDLAIARLTPALAQLPLFGLAPRA